MATRSLSEDELEAIEGKARQLTILDLKKRALAAKQGGDLETAMGRLKQAKKLEAEASQNESNGHDDDDDEPPYSSTLPLFWKKVALLCKQAGDIDRAKQALMHSKELEAAETEIETESVPANPVEEYVDSEENPLEATSPETARTATATATDPSTSEVKNEDIAPPAYENIENFTPPPPPSYNNLLHNCQVEGVANDEEAAMLAELMGGGETEKQEKRSINNVPKQKLPIPPATTEESVEIPMDDNSTESEVPEMTFTDEELMDEEMMVEFSASGVQGIPTQEEYASKELSYKKLALKFKQEGNIRKATQNLRFAKQLKKVAMALQQAGQQMVSSDEDPQSWIGSLDPEESELLGELINPSQGGGGGDELTGSAATSTTDKLTIEDIEDMEDDNDVMELVEMMGPNALPSVEDVMAKITEEKQKALKYKQEGNIEMAKASLLKSKTTKIFAQRLAGIYRKLDAKKGSDDGSGDDSGTENELPVSMDALEALMDGSHSKASGAKASAPPKPSPPKPPKDPWLLKPSAEIKAEVIRLKNEKQVKDATRLLKLFKQKLAQEQKEADREKAAKMISAIQNRLEVCTNQRRLWQYYQWFGKETNVGADQYQEWTTFEKDCRKAIRHLETEGSTSVTLALRNSEAAGKPTHYKKLYLLNDDITSLVESCTNETAFAAIASAGDESATKVPSPNLLEENTLEVAILGLFEMEQNEKLQKHLAKKPKSERAILEESPDVRIHAKLQLPIYPEDPSKPMLFDLKPSDISLPKQSSKGIKTEFKYGFDPSNSSCRRQISLPRKDPKHERSLLRRMETKTLQLSVFCLHNQNKRKEEEAAAAAAAAPKKKSWFFGRSEAQPTESNLAKGEGESKDLFLGKVTVDFKPLLSRGCLSGDFPIFVNSRAIGGVLRVCLRTRPVLDPDQYEGLPWKSSDGAPVSLSISTYKKGLSFTFPNEMNSKDNQSIELIKRESVSQSTSTQVEC